MDMASTASMGNMDMAKNMDMDMDMGMGPIKTKCTIHIIIFNIKSKYQKKALWGVI